MFRGKRELDNLIKIKFTRVELINFGFQYGHLRRKWNGMFNLFIMGVREGLIIFNTDYSLYTLRKAFQLVYFLSYKRSTGLFLWSNRFYIKNLFNFYIKVFRSKKFFRFAFYQGGYIGGLISNFHLLRKRVRMKQASFNFRLLKRRNPSFLVINNCNEFFYTFREAVKRMIPSISLIDSDLEFRDITYPIIANSGSVVINYLFCYIFILIVRKGYLHNYLQYKLKIIKIIFIILRFQLYVYMFLYEKVKILQGRFFSKKLQYLLIKNKLNMFFSFLFYIIVKFLMFKLNYSVYFKNLKYVRSRLNKLIDSFFEYLLICIRRIKKIKIEKFLKLFFKLYIKNRDKF